MNFSILLTATLVAIFCPGFQANSGAQNSLILEKILKQKAVL